MAHILHNQTKAAMREKQIVGHTHAVCHVFALDGRRRQLLGSLKHLVHTDLVCYAGSPPPDNLSHCRSVLDATILRHESYISARSGVDDPGQGCTSELRVQAHILQHCNGILWDDKIPHWCAGCCVDETGATTREMQEANMVKALSLLLGALFSAQLPALNRWPSTGRLLGYILAGMLFHRVLPRCWRLAFGEGEVPRSLEDLSDFKIYTKSKVRRVCMWFSLTDTLSNVVVYSSLVPQSTCFKRFKSPMLPGRVCDRLVGHARTHFGHVSRHVSICRSTLPLHFDWCGPISSGTASISSLSLAGFLGRPRYILRPSSGVIVQWFLPIGFTGLLIWSWTTRHCSTQQQVICFWRASVAWTAPCRLRYFGCCSKSRHRPVTN